MPKSVNNSSFSIPAELFPFFKAMFNCSSEDEWLVRNYGEKIVPYIENLVKVKTFKTSTMSLEQLKLLKSYFFKTKQSETANKRKIILPLSNGIKYCDKMASEFEDSFFREIAKKNSKLTIDSFLPSNYQKHYRKILEIQLCLFVKNELSQRIETDQLQKNEITDYQVWIDKVLKSLVSQELEIIKREENQHDYFKPSKVYYFLNGSNKTFKFIQLEYIALRQMFRNWVNDKKYFMQNSLELKSASKRLALSLGRFVFDLFYISLIPYRLLRTFVNEVSSSISLFAQDKLVTNFPSIAKYKCWLVFRFTLEFGLYFSLLYQAGLPLIPIPISWLPSVLLSTYLPLVAIAYASSILLATAVSRLYLHRLNAVHLSAAEQKPAILPLNHEESRNEVKTTLMKNHLFSRYCDQQKNISSYRSSPTPENKRISMKLYK